MDICEYSECESSFEKKTHNQRYCSDECCRLATNKRIMERYYEKKDRRNGASRKCKNTCCGARLSRYNEDDECSLCKARQEEFLRSKIWQAIVKDVV